ncbi:MAG: DUF2892 domain-containing protein [Paracoccaceae bacterium]|nr:DUF2892 domain-containing protein [Paracoccaceae bacterium]
MTANLGTLDRALRLVLGLLLIVMPFVSGLALFDTTAMKYGAVIVGLVLVATSAMKFCPLYRIFGIRTCKL